MFAAAGRLDIPIDGQQTVAYLVRRTQAFDLEHNAKTSLGFVFNKACDKLCHMKTVRNEDVVEARKRLGLSLLVVESTEIPLYSKFPVDSPQNKPSSTNQKEHAKPGTTVVHAERVVVDNKKMIKILKFENVAYMKDLPDGYLSEAPTFYKCDPPRNIKANVMFHEQIDSSNTLSYSISHGNTISIKEFGKMIKTMKEAGVHLSKINKTAKLEKEHSGEFTVSV